MVIEAEGLEAKDPNGITILKTFTNLSTYCHVLVQFCLHVCIKSSIPSHCYAVVVRLFSLIPTIQYVAMTLASTFSSLIVFPSQFQDSFFIKDSILSISLSLYYCVSRLLEPFALDLFFFNKLLLCPRRLF